MRILGIDPGTQYLGIGIVEQDGPRLTHVAHELLKPRELQRLSDKLAYIHEGITRAIETYAPDAVAIENVFHGKNAKSAIILAHARAVAILAAAQRDLEIFEYAPSQVKRAVGASGAAQKETVMQLVCALLELEDIERSDCADALAIAICHLNRTRAQDLSKGSSSRTGSLLKKRLGAVSEKSSSYTIQRQPPRANSASDVTTPAPRATIQRRQSSETTPKKHVIIRRK